MIQPQRKDDVLLTDIAATDPGDGFTVWWLGQSGFLIKSAAGHLLFDPYLSDSLTRKYAETEKPHVRMTELVIDPSRLDFIDLVTSSHNHTDHLDGETLNALRGANANLAMAGPEANRSFIAERLGCDEDWMIGLSDGEAADVGDFEVYGVPAAHEADERDEEGCCRFMGFVVKFGSHAVYHSGDTMLYDGMIEKLKPFEVDLALLPINGRGPKRRVAGNLWGREAANLAKAIGAGMVIPCHYDMFEFNTDTPKQFTDTCGEVDQPFCVLENGGRWTCDKSG